MTDPMTTPPLDLTALREIAKECLGASGGDWAHEPYGGQNQNGDYAGGHVIDRYGEYLISEVADVDGAHIAAFDPPTALALIARAEAAERDLAAVTVSRDGWQTRAKAAEKAVARVREVHPRVVIAVHESHGEEAMFPQCQHHYPCPTITALDTHTPETETTP